MSGSFFTSTPSRLNGPAESCIDRTEDVLSPTPDKSPKALLLALNDRSSDIIPSGVNGRGLSRLSRGGASSTAL